MLNPGFCDLCNAPATLRCVEVEAGEKKLTRYCEGHGRERQLAGNPLIRLVSMCRDEAMMRRRGYTLERIKAEFTAGLQPAAQPRVAEIARAAKTPAEFLAKLGFDP